MAKAFIAVLLLSLCVLSHVAAAKRHPNAISSMEEFWWFIGVVYALLILPVLFYFLYMLAKDPAAREVAPLMTQWVKHKMCGFLSPQQRSPATRDHQQPAASAPIDHAAKAKRV
ncbi:hypothetical protein Gpo141_00000124 [Globisporangium polare]